MVEYIVIVRKPQAPGVVDAVTGHTRWAEVFADIFFGTTLKPEVFEIIERTASGVEVYNRTQMEAVGAAVDDWIDDTESWRNALP